MFVISKIAGFVLLPSNLIGLAAILGVLALLFGKARTGATLLVLAALLFVVRGWAPAGRFALAVLEDQFPRPDVEGPVTGIVMLGGAINTHITAARGQGTLNAAGERVTTVAALARRFPEARLLLSGGGSDLTGNERTTESAVARDLLVAMGTDQARIELEEKSRTTCENATQSLAMARPAEGDRWLLVTSASHMPRAVACFRAAGFPVIPYPVDFRTRGQDDWQPFGAASDGLADSDLAAHEWIGLVTYRLLGRTDAVLPAVRARP